VASKQIKRPRRNSRGNEPVFDASRRAAGILLHLTSLPGPHGNGDLGPEARRIAEFLSAAGQRWWQMLPANPVGHGNSPYSGASAFAGNPLLISLEDLVEDGLLRSEEIAFRLNGRRCDYAEASVKRSAALRQAFARHQARPRRLTPELERLRHEAAYWLPDYALYMALRKANGDARWPEWPRELAQRQPLALRRARRELADEVAYYELEQLLFRRQWQRLRDHASAVGVGLIGDAPIFIAHESADVWAHADLFLLDRAGEPTHVAGVPPDYFSKTGQRWGNPLYRWSRMQEQGFEWWIERFRTLVHHFDLIRLDHFIGFSRFWKVPASEPTAEHGTWQPAPGAALFSAVRAALGATPFIAEDLGEVTPAVRQLRDDFELPGMRILQFAFGGDTQADQFLPHAYVRNSVAYTGTHDNETFVGWFEDDGSEGPRSPAQARKERQSAISYLAGPHAEQLATDVHWEALRALYASAAHMAVVPMQDVLGLGNEARMNSPGSAQGNWEWRLGARAANVRLARTLRKFSTVYARAGVSSES
jgi:4-alpha-glucanotransferase